MKLSLPEETMRVREEFSRWATDRRARIGTIAGFEPAAWKEFVDLGLLHGSVEGIRMLDIAVGLIAASEGSLPGPVLEAELALSSGNEEAAESLSRGDVVTSVLPRPGRTPTLVAGGALASLIVDQRDGSILARGPLPPARTEVPLDQGFLETVPAGGSADDPLAARRRLLAAAIVVGLGKGALAMAREHVRDREQFGRPLASFQAVQFMLAECAHMLEATELGVVDAARRVDAGDPLAGATAALTWIWARLTSVKVEQNTHQVFGAIGFTSELGLVRLTWQMAWLRTSVGAESAQRDLLAARKPAPGVPYARILAGFSA